MDSSSGPAFDMFWIFPLLCLAFMAVMMVMCLRGGRTSSGRRFATPPDGGHETPRQILDRRLAGGQIGHEQYDQMRRDLEASGGAR